jgi:hypothetical protein
MDDRTFTLFIVVIAGLDPAIQEQLAPSLPPLDARLKAGHDGEIVSGFRLAPE